MRCDATTSRAGNIEILNCTSLHVYGMEPWNTSVCVCVSFGGGGGGGGGEDSNHSARGSHRNMPCTSTCDGNFTEILIPYTTH